MSEFGKCEGGCTEQKLELVHADHYDRSIALAASARIHAEAFRAIAEELVSRQPHADECEAAYLSVQEAARLSLRRYPEDNVPEADRGEPPELATTWWCAKCGGLDAPQPCLGICIWRRVDWVDASLEEQARARADAQRDTERLLRLLVRRVASVTPHTGQWERGWSALEAQARQTLRACRGAAESAASSR